jgi:hypothetical protein
MFTSIPGITDSSLGIVVVGIRKQEDTAKAVKGITSTQERNRQRRTGFAPPRFNESISRLTSTSATWSIVLNIFSISFWLTIVR